MVVIASEEMSFENVNDDDGRMDDRRRLPGYTISSPMSFRLIIDQVLNELANLRSWFLLYSDITVPVNLAIKVIEIQYTQLGLFRYSIFFFSAIARKFYDKLFYKSREIVWITKLYFNFIKTDK